MAGCWSVVCSCGNSSRTGCAGRTSTSPDPRSMKASLTGIPRRAERARPCAAWSRSRWTSRTGACRQTDFRERVLMVADGGGYDIVILGGGSGGYACALRAAELGKRVALVEKDRVGGTCLHRGCIPTKALLHAAELADQAAEGANFGVLSTFDGIDMAGVNAYKDRVVTRLWKGLTGLIGSRHIDIIEGQGRLASPTAVQV